MKVKINKDYSSIKIKIDVYDLYNADYTLALVILPVLRELRKQEQFSFNVELEDVPIELHPPVTEKVSNCLDIDNLYFKRVRYVMDEMINAFDSIVNEYEDKDYNEMVRIKNGLRLFGKYYLALWI